MRNEVVVMDQPGLVKLRAFYLWEASDGTAHTDERGARYASCTHRPCEDCGAPTEKFYLRCKGCRDLNDRKRYDAMPKKAWDGVAMLYSHASDTYFNSIEEAEDALEGGVTLDDMMLVICEGNYPSKIDPDYWSDDMAEDGELPPEMEEALEAFNAVVAKCPALSWSPGKFALDLTGLAS